MRQSREIPTLDAITIKARNLLFLTNSETFDFRPLRELYDSSTPVKGHDGVGAVALFEKVFDEAGSAKLLLVHYVSVNAFHQCSDTGASKHRHHRRGIGNVNDPDDASVNRIADNRRRATPCLAGLTEVFSAVDSYRTTQCQRSSDAVCAAVVLAQIRSSHNPARGGKRFCKVVVTVDAKHRSARVTDHHDRLCRLKIGNNLIEAGSYRLAKPSVLSRV
jgi:hypothetical protein